MTTERSPVLQRFVRTVIGFDLREDETPLVDQALTHKSHAFEAESEKDNERLEFLGDAVVGLVVSEALFEEFQDQNEGWLSQAKAAVVSRKTLGHRARELGFGEMIRFGKGEAQSGGAARLSTLGAALEALVGAVYLLRGFEAAAAFVRKAILEASRAELLAGATEDYKSRLQELTQARMNCLPRYLRIGESGPDHEKIYEVEVRIEDVVYGRGQGRRLKEAEHAAAYEAMTRLNPPPT